MAADEGGGDQVAGRTTVQQEGGGVRGDGAGELDERSTGHVAVVDVRDGVGVTRAGAASGSSEWRLRWRRAAKLRCGVR